MFIDLLRLIVTTEHARAPTRQTAREEKESVTQYSPVRSRATHNHTCALHTLLGTPGVSMTTWQPEDHVTTAVMVITEH